MKAQAHGTSTPAPRLSQESGTLESLARGWDWFWFNPADPTTLGLIRICCGLVVLYVHLAYTVDLQVLFGKNAWMDLSTANYWRKDTPYYAQPAKWDVPPDLDNPTARGNPVWSVWYHVTDPGWMMTVHVGILLCMFLFTIGFCTRVTSVLTWVGAVSYIQRAPTTLFGQDAIQMILLFYLMIGPSGAALSVDRLISRWWARRRGRNDLADLSPAPLVSANFVVRLMQIHFCIIYFASGSSKLLGGMWWNGTATYYTMANYEFAPLDMPLYRDMLAYLCRHRWAWEIFMGGGTAFTLVMEIGFPFMVWNRRLRPFMIVGAVMLHVGIAVFMGLVGFGLTMLSLLIAFVPSDAVQRWVAALGETVRPMFKFLSRREPDASKELVAGAKA